MVLEYSQCTGGVYFEAQDRCLELEMSSLMSWLWAFDQAYCVVGLLVRQCKANNEARVTKGIVFKGSDHNR